MKFEIVSAVGITRLNKSTPCYRPTTHNPRHALMKILAFVITSVIILLPAWANADQASQKSKLSDIRLVLDISGSMKQNDPANLRKPSVELLMQLLPAGSRAGIWTFGEGANILVKHQVVNDAWKEAGKANASKINSQGLYTNIGEALQSAAYDKDSLDPDVRTSIILLTDGMVDIDKDSRVNAKEWRRIVDEVLPQLKRAGYIIHTVALSDNADNNLLNKLSLQTDGIAEVANTAEELMSIFLKAFDAASPVEQIPLANNSFVVDSSVEEFTALIFRNDNNIETKLTGPDGSEYSAASHTRDVNWYGSDKYDLITVSQPLEGGWNINVEMDSSSRVTIVSNLNLQVKPLPNNVFVGAQPSLSFSLAEDGTVISRSQFLKLMDVSLNIKAGKSLTKLESFWSEQYPKGKSPRGGRYVFELPEFEQAGVYELQILVDGKSFKREFIHRFSVREPFFASIEQRFVNGNLGQVLKVIAHGSNIDLTRTQVVANISDPEKKKTITTLALTDMDTWEATITPNLPGKYRIDIDVNSSDLQAVKTNFKLDTLIFDYDEQGDITEHETPFSVTDDDKGEGETVLKDKVEETKKMVEEGSQVESPSFPTWLIYVVVGAANILFFGVGFLILRKIFGKTQDEESILEEFSEKTVEEKTMPSESEAVATTEATVDEEEEFEPPMENLDVPTTDEQDAPIDEDMLTDISGEPDDEDDIDPPMEDISAATDQGIEIDEDEIDIEALLSEQGSVDDGIDDIDEMGIEDLDPEHTEIEGESEKQEDMTEAMLKAQGLDLSSDEMDDAINSLIDDLDSKPEKDP